MSIFLRYGPDVEETNSTDADSWLCGGQETLCPITLGPLPTLCVCCMHTDVCVWHKLHA